MKMMIVQEACLLKMKDIEEINEFEEDETKELFSLNFGGLR